MSARELLVVRHVPWEGAHRILDAFPATPVRHVDVLASDDPLPAPNQVCGAVFMGGPMSVNDGARHPRLLEELAWLERAIADGLPVLGVCLGSQLIARALGAAVRPGTPEIGYAPIEVLDRSDPLVGPLAPWTTVLHWHGEAFDLPPGATALARSARTEVQAFRAHNAWGLLFHPEADERLVELWLDEPAMVEDARRAHGDEYAQRLRADARSAATNATAGVPAAFARACHARG